MEKAYVLLNPNFLFLFLFLFLSSVSFCRLSFDFQEFNPDRWNVPTTKAQGARKEGEVPTHAPTCPFLAHASRMKSEGLAGGDDMVRYSGLGHEEGGLDFFPFSAGTICNPPPFSRTALVPLRIR